MRIDTFISGTIPVNGSTDSQYSWALPRFKQRARPFHFSYSYSPVGNVYVPFRR
jgi:hypothetical protein